MKQIDLVQEVRALLTRIYGKGWENCPAFPNTDEVSSVSYQNIDMLARGTGQQDKIFRDLALIQLVGAYLDEFKSRGPSFPLTASNPGLAALIITPPTFADALQWHVEHPGYEGGEKLRKLEPELKKYWKRLRSQLLP